MRRTTVTTIETHEVWIIRRPDVSDEAVTITPDERTQPAPAPLVSERKHERTTEGESANE